MERCRLSPRMHAPPPLRPRYNLLREDSEGYAKLVVALNHFSDAAIPPDMVDALYKEIQAGARAQSFALHVACYRVWIATHAGTAPGAAWSVAGCQLRN